LHLSLLFHDPRLCFIVFVAAAVSLLTTLNVAARPAAVQTGRVALAFTISSLFFMLTRFANLFYLPLLGSYVDRAAPAGAVTPDPAKLETLYHQIQWVVAGASIGTLGAWLLLPTFIELYRRGIQAVERHQSMIRVLVRSANPRRWPTIIGSFTTPSLMGVKLGKLEGVPRSFLLANMLATAIWTVGALCASLASARQPQLATTAILLSGMVNAFAAIAFTIWVDPIAALITDQAIKGERPKEQVTSVAVHLAAGSFLGSILGLLVLEPGTEWIEKLTLSLGSHTSDGAGSLWLLIGINLLVMLLQSAATMDRVSGVLTKRVATALSVYNVFFLVTRLAQQVYAPLLGSMSDHAVRMHDLGTLFSNFQRILLGATIGVFVGVLLMPTFVQLYCRAITELEQHGSMSLLCWKTLLPKGWRAVLGCLRRPSLFGIRMADLRTIPRGFIYGNVLVISITTVGTMAAIYAGAEHQHFTRTCTLLSSVVNGLATITLSLVVNPMSALITDQCVAGERPVRHIYAMAVFLTVGTLAGTLLSQIVFWPAAEFIGFVAVHLATKL
jgi:hypothetical protein